MRFSQRLGYSQVKTVAEREVLDEDTRNGLWSVVMVTCFEDAVGRHLDEVPTIHNLIRQLWFNFYKQPIDTIPDWGPKAIQHIRSYFFNAAWYDALDLVEFLGQHSPDAANVRDLVNTILEREVSAYRFVGESIAEITSRTEIDEVENAQKAAGPGARFHLERAVELLADRTNPDYRNAVKEAISAVEATVNERAGTKNLTLGDALRRLNPDMHGAFKTALGNLYGYTSDSEGIRHSLLEEPTIDYADAKFMVVACSAFVNYLVTKTSG
jgi:hypothetical protein